MVMKNRVFGLVGLLVLLVGCDFGSKEALIRLELEKTRMQLQEQLAAANEQAKATEAARREAELKLQDALVANKIAEESRVEAEKSRQDAMVSQLAAEQNKEEALKSNEFAAMMKKENETLRTELEQTRQLLEKAQARIAELEKR